MGKFRKILLVIGCLLLLPVQAQELQKGGLGILVAQMYSPDLYNNIGPLIVLRVIEATPAAANGLEKGDIITHIDGEPTTGKQISALIANELRGPVDSSVMLTIQREYTHRPFDVKLTRMAFEFPSYVRIR